GELVIAQANPRELKAPARAQILPKGKCWTSPVHANGRIYARNAAGDMACVDVGSTCHGFTTNSKQSLRQTNGE
ncbi:MAG: hypothetical protein JSW59_04050, partial [Phycisphaerales bacterium]